MLAARTECYYAERLVTPRRVLLMACELDLGGSERQLTVVAKALDRSRFEPIVGCFRPAGMRGRELAAAGVRVVSFPVYSFASVAAVSGAWRLGRFIRSQGIGLVHTFDATLTAFAIPAGRFLTRAVMVSSQRSHRELIRRQHLPAIRATDRLADAIVVNCEFVRRHLEEEEGVAGSRIRLCYNGIDLDEFQAGSSPRPPSLPADALVIGVVCAMRPEKNLAVLLQAFARLGSVKARLKLAVVGSGPTLTTLESEAGRLGILDQCVFAPATDRVAEWLRAIEIFVLPSRSEALSNSLMEAMACGCCAVASNVGGNPELVQNGETGLLFEPDDAAGLAERLELLIENEALRRRLAEAGTRWIRARFSVRASASRMAEIYEELLERRAMP